MSTHLELRQLRYFVAVAEALSFRKAADALALTQPPLTRQVQALEDALGVQLLVRDRRGVELTAEGRDVLKAAQALLAQADALAGRYRRGQGSSGAGAQPTLRLGITTVVDASLFTWVEPALAAAKSEVTAGLKIEIRRQISQKSIADLMRGRLDAAVIGLPSQTHDLVVEKLTDDPLMVAMPSSHRLAKAGAVDLKALEPGPLFWFKRALNPAYYDHFERVFRQLGFAPDRLPEPQDHHVLLGLIADGQGVALVPRSLTAIARLGVVYKRLRRNGPFQIGLALAAPAEAGHPAVAELREMLRSRFPTR